MALKQANELRIVIETEAGYSSSKLASAKLSGSVITALLVGKPKEEAFDLIIAALGGQVEPILRLALEKIISDMVDVDELDEDVAASVKVEG